MNAANSAPQVSTAFITGTIPARARRRALDEFPRPAWDLFDLTPYFEVGEGHGVERGRSMPGS